MRTAWQSRARTRSGPGFLACGRFARRVFLSSLLLAHGLATPGAGAQPSSSRSDPGISRLQREIGRLSGIAEGKLGVAAIHLETGREVYLNGGERFPMASSYKVPIAVELLTRVDRGEVRLDSLVRVEPGDLHPGSGTLTNLFDDPGVILSIHNLLELMLLISDNSATDIMLEVAGGAEAVSGRMRELEIDGLRVDRPTVRLIADWLGVRNVPTSGEISPNRWRELAEAVSEPERDAAAAAFDSDPRDTSTPEAMAKLLAKVWRGEALSEESTKRLLDIMRRCQTGESRIKGMLPPGVEVDHKTGTIGGTTNDVGIINLPDDAGHVVTVVFVKESKVDTPVRERAIAQIARAIYDYFLFNPGG
ncbi:MAG: class A beta-lactamase [Gemmatimonadetes bacterium]|nr:class A beta-lactamase [Gemmatimonadota bacterium]